GRVGLRVVRATKRVAARTERMPEPSGRARVPPPIKRWRIFHADTFCWFARQWRDQRCLAERIATPIENSWPPESSHGAPSSRKNAAPATDGAAACRRYRRKRCSCGLRRFARAHRHRLLGEEAPTFDKHRQSAQQAKRRRGPGEDLRDGANG